MKRSLNKLFLIWIALVWFVAGCGSNAAPANEISAVDIQGTIEAGVVATSQALAAAEPTDSFPTATPEPDVRDLVDNLGPATEEPVAATESPPTPSATRADTNPPLALPFVDSFDQGLRPEWRVINGQPLVSNGRLTSAVDELSLEIGNTTLTDYTLSFDVSGDEGCGTGYWKNLELGFSPTLKMTYSDTDYNGRLTWWTWYENDWSMIDRQERLDCGRFGIVVFGNTYQVRLNGTLVSELVFGPASGPLLVSIDESVYIDNLSIEP
jgi:hypothetical protein